MKLSKRKILNWLFFLALGISIIGLPACSFDVTIDDDDNSNCEEGDGGVIEQTLSLNDFQTIELKIDAEVYIKQGAPQKVEVEGQENIISLLDRSVRNGAWEIEFDQCVRDNDDLKIYITTPDIEKLEIKGSGDIISENLLEVGDLVLRVSGSGNIDLEVEADDIDSKISGSGEIILAGATDNFDLEVAGSGDYSAFNLDAKKGDIEIAGSGDAEVRVENVLDIEIRGSGDVSYKGTPTLSVNITGSGNVIDAN